MRHWRTIPLLLLTFVAMFATEMTTFNLACQANARAQVAYALINAKARGTELVAAVDANVVKWSLVTLNANTFGFLASSDGNNYCSITSGLKVLTTPNTCWTSADVGKTIHVQGAGAAGATLVTTIAAYTAVGSVTLTDAAGTTVAASKTGLVGIAIWGFDLGTISEVSPLTSNDGTLAYTRSGAYNSVVMNGVSRTVAAHFADWRSVKDYGAVGNGTADDTAAIALAIASFPTGQGTVYFPPGDYLTTAPTLVTQNRIHLVGAGSWATRIIYTPTASNSAFKIANGASVVYQGSVKGFCFYSMDSTYNKVALELVDTSGYLVEDIVVSGSIQVGSSYFWSGGTASTGILLRGREITSVSRLYVFADKPVVIGDNPNSTIDVDHLHVSDTYLAATTANPCVTINDGVNLTSVTFDGYNAWVLGTHGLYWNDTTTAQVAYALSIKGVRTEQGQLATAYSIYVSHNYALHNISITDCTLDGARRGVYLRKTRKNSIRDSHYPSALEFINMNALAEEELTLDNVFVQTGSTATLTGLVEKFGTNKPINGSPVPTTAFYGVAGATVTAQTGWRSFGVMKWATKISLANGATSLLPVAPNNGNFQNATLTVSGYSSTGPIQEGGVALVFRNGNAVTAGATSNFSAGSATAAANKLHVWNQGGACVIQNNTGQTVTVVIDAVWYE